MQRRLAAILAADLVGYSRLMEAEEAATLQRLTALRESLLLPLIQEHRGRLVKLMGDGIIAFWLMGLYWAQHQPERYEARAALQDDLRIAPHHTTADAGKVPCRDPAPLAKFVARLRRAGLPDPN